MPLIRIYNLIQMQQNFSIKTNPILILRAQNCEVCHIKVSTKSQDCDKQKHLIPPLHTSPVLSRPLRRYLDIHYSNTILPSVGVGGSWWQCEMSQFVRIRSNAAQSPSSTDKKPLWPPPGVLLSLVCSIIQNYFWSKTGKFQKMRFFIFTSAKCMPFILYRLQGFSAK